MKEISWRWIWMFCMGVSEGKDSFPKILGWFFMYPEDYLGWFFGFQFFMAIVCAYFCERIGENKGYASGAVTGFFFGFLALVYYAGLPDKKQQDFLIEVNDNLDYIHKVLKDIRIESLKASTKSGNKEG